jgi:hypothetical protein
MRTLDAPLPMILSGSMVGTEGNTCCWSFLAVYYIAGKPCGSPELARIKPFRSLHSQQYHRNDYLACFLRLSGGMPLY